MKNDNDGRMMRLIIIAAALVVVLAAAVTALAIGAARESGESKAPDMNVVPEVQPVSVSAPAPTIRPEIATEEPHMSAEPDDTFIVRTYEGFIAVFRPGSAKPESVTDTRISSLRRADQILLREGVTIQGRESLARFLEDFSY